MSGKSKHGRGKGPSQSRKKRNIHRSKQLPVARTQADAHPQAVVRSAEPAVIPPEMTAAPSAAPAATTTGASYPNLPYELRRSGILAGIILTALVVLVLLLG